MTEILHSAINPGTLEAIKKELATYDVISTEVPDADFLRLIKKKDKEYSIVILGNTIMNPFRVAQAVHQRDKLVSILIISSVKNLENLKHGMRFTPFIGNAVMCIADQSESEIARTVLELVKKTQQRRNYRLLKAGSHDFFGDKPHLDVIKREFLNKYLEFAPIGTILLDHNKIVAINEYATHIFGEDEKALLNRNFIELFSPELREQLEDHIQNELAAKQFEKHNGHVQHLEIRVAGIPQGYKLLICSDITDTVNARSKIEDQLLSLKKINRDLETFVYTASHDLKAPITNVEGLVGLLQDLCREEHVNREEIHSIIDMISRSIKRFNLTINDLADITRIENVIPSDLQIIEISEVVENIKLSIGEDIKSAGALIINECDSKILFSKKNFNSLLYNLISNAIRYRHPDRTPEIYICSTQKNGDIIISVKDNGLGIPEEKKDAIFNMFYRLHTQIEGSGMGLFIVKRIVENAGGKIELISELNEGSEFRIYLSKD